MNKQLDRFHNQEVLANCLFQLSIVLVCLIVPEIPLIVPSPLLHQYTPCIFLTVLYLCDIQLPCAHFHRFIHHCPVWSGLECVLV